jgi:hypothetical protein
MQQNINRKYPSDKIMAHSSDYFLKKKINNYSLVNQKKYLEHLPSESFNEGAPARELSPLLKGGASESEARLPTCFLGSLLLSASKQVIKW